MKLRFVVVLGATAVALVALAGSATATSITSPTGTLATPTIKAESEGHVTLDSAVGEIKCNSTIEAKVEQHGVAVTAKAPISTLTTSGCTGGWHFTTLAAGTLEIHWTSGYNGTVKSTGTVVSTTVGGITCAYETNNTHIGTLTGGTPATLDIAAKIPVNAGTSSPFCGTEATTWTGSYKLASPESLFVDAGVVPGTSITSPTGTLATPTIKAESEGHVTLDSAIGAVKCNSTAEGKVETHGPEVPASGNLSALSFTNCTEGWHVTVLAQGSLAIEHTSGYNGTVRSTGAEVWTTVGGITCVYGTNNTDIGTLTGGTPATLDIQAKIPIIAEKSSAFCGTQPISWTGSYKLTSPESLFVDAGVEPETGTSITSPTGTLATPTIKAESEGHVTLDSAIGAVKCNSTAEGKVETHGPEVPASGNLSALSFTNCTEGWHVTVLAQGSLAIEHTSGYNGTVRSTGAEVSTTVGGITCVYGTNNTDIGTLTGGTPATLDIQAKIPIIAEKSSAFCGTAATIWTGSYKLTSPESLFVDAA